MDPIKWLEAYAPGFMQISEDERQAILDFTLLWSFFETRAMQTRGSSKRIRELANNWGSSGLINVDDFAAPLAYFSQRYFNNNQPTTYYGGLNLRDNDYPGLVKTVLRGDVVTPAETLSALLIVVFRLRNNLFHGTKWAYGIQDQLTNFKYANAILMGALAINGPL
jgi:hypothetical protein